MSKPLETNEQVYIDASDFVLRKIHSHQTFGLPPILQRFNFNQYEPYISQEDYDNLSIGKYSSISIWMLRNGIITTIANSNYQLTDIGREMKRLKGWRRYYDLLARKDQATFDTVLWLKWAAGGAVATAMLTLFIFINDLKCNQIHPNSLNKASISKTVTKTALDTAR